MVPGKQVLEDQLNLSGCSMARPSILKLCYNHWVMYSDCDDNLHQARVCSETDHIFAQRWPRLLPALQSTVILCVFEWQQ